MTEKEAWQECKSIWETAFPNENGVYRPNSKKHVNGVLNGLCIALEEICYSDIFYNTMINRMDNNIPKECIVNKYSHWWRWTKEDMESRIKFCQKMIDLCEQEEKANEDQIRS